jgi:hypothetical protein
MKHKSLLVAIGIVVEAIVSQVNRYDLGCTALLLERKQTTIVVVHHKKTTRLY